MTGQTTTSSTKALLRASGQRTQSSPSALELFDVMKVHSGCHMRRHFFAGTCLLFFFPLLTAL